MENVINILKERGLLEDITNPDLPKVLEKRVTVYAGFDPTSDSLQVGNLVAVLALAHFQRCGHSVIAVVGGATGLIGDPSGKATERELLGEEDVQRNVEGVRENLSRFLDLDHPIAPAKVLNNNDWLGKFTFIGFLRDAGKHFRMGTMLGKESVKARLAGEAGMSFTEFSYQLLQAYDFLRLYDVEGCVLQVGGSDQWGNITAGIDLVRKLRGVETYGLTLPLVCDSAGRKFGKSENNAVYLNRGKTSCYGFYQFFLRASDDDVVRLLKAFTFLPLEEIGELEREQSRSPEERIAQKRLAEEVTRLVHGEDGLRIATRASSVLFGGSIAGLRAMELLEIFANVPSTELSREQVEGTRAGDLAALCGLCSSKSDARRLIESGGLYLNHCRIDRMEREITASDIVDGRVLVLRSGKKNFHVVKVAGGR